jgi:hypothetical protein
METLREQVRRLVKEGFDAVLVRKEPKAWTVTEPNNFKARFAKTKTLTYAEIIAESSKSGLDIVKGEHTYWHSDGTPTPVNTVTLENWTDRPKSRIVLQNYDWVGWLCDIDIINALDHLEDATESQLKELLGMQPRVMVIELERYAKHGWLPQLGAVPDWQDSLGGPMPVGQAPAAVPTPVAQVPYRPKFGLPLEADGLPPIESGDAFFADDSITTPPAVIEGYFHRTDQVIMGGGSKTHKSWILEDMGLCVAHGIDWQGLKTVKGPVLYINFELQRGWLRKRLKEIAKARGLAGLGDFDVWNLRGFASDLTLLTPRILARVATRDYVLIILDPLYKCLGDRDENSAGDMNDLCNLIGNIAEVSGAAVIYAHHFSKGNQANKDAKDRVSGSGVFGRSPDGISTITAHRDDGVFSFEITCRNLEAPKAFCIQWKHPVMHRRDDLDPADLQQAPVGGRKQIYKGKDLLKLLQRPLLTMEWFSIAEEELGCSKSSFLRAKNDLKKAGKIENDGNDKWQPTAPKY